MVFDIRGKRRHVVKVVYAVLAVLMGLSLFLVVGPVNINALLGNGSGSSSAAQPFEEQAEQIEVKLRKSPEDADLLAALTKARISAGDGSAERTSEGQTVITADSLQQYQLASQAWSKYMKASEEPSANVAQLIAPRLISLAEGSGVGELEANVDAAAEAQQIVAEQRPSIGSLSTLAIYRYYAFDYPAARKTEAEAIAMGKDKFERESIENKLQPYEKSAKELQKELAKIQKAAKGVGSSGSAGTKGSLESPLGGFGANALTE